MPNKWYGTANYKQNLKYMPMFGLLAFWLVVPVMLADSYKIKQESNNAISKVTGRLEFQVTDIIILSFNHMYEKHATDKKTYIKTAHSILSSE